MREKILTQELKNHQNNTSVIELTLDNKHSTHTASHDYPTNTWTEMWLLAMHAVLCDYV